MKALSAPQSLSNNLSKVNTLPDSRLRSSFDPLKTFQKTQLTPGHRFFNDCLRENWARFIDWKVRGKNLSSWFVTQTFKNEESLRSADKKYRIWAGRLKQSLIDHRGCQLRWIRANEWQLRNVIHFHSLIQGIGLDLLSRKSWEDRWESLNWNTGFCRIHDADLKAAPYLAKYTSKRLGGDLEWGGYWQGIKTPFSVSCVHSIRPVLNSVETRAASDTR